MRGRSGAGRRDERVPGAQGLRPGDRPTARSVPGCGGELAVGEGGPARRAPRCAEFAHDGFVGQLGSPVNPGITTSKEAVFLGRFVHGPDRAPSFRPHIGCVPASGGGQRVPTAYHAAAPGKPVQRRVFEVAVRPGKTSRYVGRCLANERLAAATHAVAFYADAPPTADLARAVGVSQRIRAGHAELTIRASSAVSGAHAVVQLDLLCVAR